MLNSNFQQQLMEKIMNYNKQILTFEQFPSSNLLMKPINCAFHPKELIVNFCRNPSCLLPMCPNCVKLHSKQHTVGNTFGEFQSIHEVYEEVESNLQNVLKGLVNFNQDLKEVFCEKQARRQELKKRMSEYRMKVISSIERYIDQLQTQILNTMGGHASNIEDEFNKINQKIQLISKNVEKEFRTLNGQKTLKGIITHFNKNMTKFYDQKLDQIMTEIGELQSKDLQICKQFRLNQLIPIHQKIHEVYKTIFVGTINPKTFKDHQSRVSNSSRASTTK